MRILLIDDDDEVLDRLREALSDLDLDWIYAATKEEARAALEESAFDLVLCDLKMPPDSVSTELSFEHGVAAAEEARNLAPGTPILIYSGFRKEAEFEALVSESHPADLYGLGEVATVRSFDKTKPDLLYEVIRYHHDGLRGLANSVDVTDSEGEPVALDEYDKRILRMYARIRGGTLARVTPMDGGRSKARTLRLDVVGVDGVTRAKVVVKLNQLPQVVADRIRFDEHVAGRLGAGTYADSTRHIMAGAGPRGGTFYSFATAYPKSLFRILSEDPAEAAHVVTRLAKALEPWQQTRVGAQQTLEELCNELSPPSKRTGLPSDTPDLSALSDMGITLWMSSSHNDLHGGNILVGADGAPMLIDFGDTGVGPSLLDPITLELSAVLHPDSPFRHDAWPRPDQCLLWNDLVLWREGCSYADFVASCRSWQAGNARGTRDRDAVLLGYSLRQMTFPDARYDVLQALVKGALARLASS